MAARIGSSRGDQVRKWLFQPQKPFYEIEVSLADFAFFGHETLALLGFFGKNVPFECFLEGNFTRAGYPEPFLGTGIRFDLRHITCFFCNSLLAGPHWRSTYGAVWGGKITNNN